MKKRLGVIRFPGTNCDRDVFEMGVAKGYESEYLWHLDQFDVAKFETLVLPGGFSYGDYLRSGALAARSPVMKSVREFAKKGGPVLGICNGFQVLTEAGLLPGALLKNIHRRFVDDWVVLKKCGESLSFAKSQETKELRLPVAHGDGRYFADEDLLKKIYDTDQVWFQYVESPNGSVDNIAGVLNENKNVAGLMPHPERALYSWMGSVDGWEFL